MSSLAAVAWIVTDRNRLWDGFPLASGTFDVSIQRRAMLGGTAVPKLVSPGESRIFQAVLYDMMVSPDEFQTWNIVRASSGIVSDDFEATAEYEGKFWITEPALLCWKLYDSTPVALWQLRNGWPADLLDDKLLSLCDDNGYTAAHVIAELTGEVRPETGDWKAHDGRTVQEVAAARTAVGSGAGMDH